MSQTAPVTASLPQSIPAAPARPGLVLPTLTLWKREIVRFLRQKNRVVGALATPVVFWALLGSGLNRSFAPGGADSAAGGTSYLEYFFPGTVVFIILSTAIFSTFSVIEDRREGFLQAVLVSPAPRLSIVLGKVLGGAALATLQGFLFMLFWPLVTHWPGAAAGVEHMAAATGVMFLLGVELTALGLCVAWPMDSTAGFHAVMMLFLMPMWFLSGAVFPITAGTPLWLKAVMYVNPLTYGQAIFAATLTGRSSGVGVPVEPWIAALVTVLATLAIVLFAAMLVSKPRKDGLA